LRGGFNMTKGLSERGPGESLHSEVGEKFPVQGGVLRSNEMGEVLGKKALRRGDQRRKGKTIRLLQEKKKT